MHLAVVQGFLLVYYCCFTIGRFAGQILSSGALRGVGQGVQHICPDGHWHESVVWVAKRACAIGRGE